MPNGKPRFHPMPGKIVVEPISEEESKIILLDDPRGRVMGIITAIGGDETEVGDEYDLQVGDTVLFSQNSGVKVKVERVEVRVFRTAEILCKISWPEDDENLDLLEQDNVISLKQAMRDAANNRH